MSSVMSRSQMGSEPDFLSAVRKAASDINSEPAPSQQRRRHGGSSRSESNLHSQVSRRSRKSRDSRGGSSYLTSSSYDDDDEAGMTLKDMQNHVQNSAMDRYIGSLQTEAQEAVKDGTFWSRKVQEDKNEERNEVKRRREQNTINQFGLRNQMEENKMRRAEDRREFVEAASAHSFPLFGETFISLDEYNAYLKGQKDSFRTDLTDQLLRINTMKNLKKKEDKDWAESRRVQCVSDMQKDRKAERSRLANQGKDMVASWDRDIRLQNIKKAITSGKDVVKETMKPGALAATGSSMGRSRS